MTNFGKKAVMTGGLLAILLSADAAQQNNPANTKGINNPTSIVIQQDNLSVRVNEIISFVESKGMLSYSTIAGEDVEYKELDMKEYNIIAGDNIFGIYKKTKGKRAGFFDFKKDKTLDVYVKMKSYPDDMKRMEVLDEAYTLYKKQRKNTTIGKDKYFLIKNSNKIDIKKKYENLINEVYKALNS